MPNTYLVGISPTSGRLEAPQAGDTAILAGPVDMYDDKGISGRDGNGDMLFTHSGAASGYSDWDFPWTTGYTQFFTHGVNHFAGGVSSPGPVAIDINAGDRANYNVEWPQVGEISYVTSESNATAASSAWFEQQYLDETDVAAGTVGAMGAANSIKWSNWTEGTHMVNTGQITIDSKVNSISGSRVQLKSMAGSSNGIIASYYSTQSFITGFDKAYDFWGDAANGINTKKLYARNSLVVDTLSTLTGTVDMDANVTIGDSSSKTINCKGRFSSNLDPNSDDQRSLGSTNLQWKDLWIDGTANIDLLKADKLGAAMNCDNQDMTYVDINSGAIDGTTIGVTTPSSVKCTTLVSTGNTDLGNAATDTLTVAASIDSNLVPSADGTKHLGTSAKQWGDLYINGTANIDLLKADKLGADMNCDNKNFTNVDINNGAIDGTTIGSSDRSTIKCTTLDATGNISTTADVIASSSSDERLKDNITVIGNALSKVKTLRGVEFDWNSKQDTFSGHDIGIVAQDVEKVAPEIVVDRDTGYKAVKYEKLVPILIEAIKELSDKVDTLEGNNRSSSF